MSCCDRQAGGRGLDRAARRDQDAEAYNLLFNKCYTDASIGWRAAARKIVVVIGDAEPHSAGAEGIVWVRRHDRAMGTT